MTEFVQRQSPPDIPRGNSIIGTDRILLLHRTIIPNSKRISKSLSLKSIIQFVTTWCANTFYSGFQRVFDDRQWTTSPLRYLDTDIPLPHKMTRDTYIRGRVGRSDTYSVLL